MAKKAFAGIALLATAAVAISGCAGGGANDADNTIDGEVKGDIKVVTWRTDLVEDGTFEKYAEEFNKEYPDVKVTFEGITDYAGEMLTRMSTTNYGDVIGIPAIKPDQYEQFLEPLGETADFEDTYRFLPAASYDGTQYGIAWGGNANGVVYNKKIFEEAGVTELPTSRRRVAGRAAEGEGQHRRHPDVHELQGRLAAHAELRQPRRHHRRPRRADHDGRRPCPLDRGHGRLRDRRRCCTTPSRPA